MGVQKKFIVGAAYTPNASSGYFLCGVRLWRIHHRVQCSARCCLLLTCQLTVSWSSRTEDVHFAYAGPSNWNSLPAYLRDSSLSLSSFKHTSKPFSSLSTRLAHAARLGFFYKNALYKFIVVIIIIVTLAVSVAVCEIISAKEWCDLKNRVRVRSRSLEMARFDRPCMTFC